MRNVVQAAWVWCFVTGCGGGLSYYKPAPEPAGPTTDDTVEGQGGNNGGGNNGGNNTGGTTEPAFVPVLDALTPNFGSDAGGRVVELTGTFDADTEVFVDGEPAEISDFAPERLEIVVPAGSVTGWVDVEVVSGTESATLDDAFQYFADGTGLSGTIGSLWYQTVQGNYWADPQPVPAAGGWFAYIEPSPWERYKDYVSTIGDCEFDFSDYVSVVAYDPGATRATFSGDSVVVLPDATTDIAPGWFAAELVPGVDVSPGDEFDLDSIAGDRNWPEFDRPAAVTVPSSFRITSPNLDGNTLPNLSRTLQLQWAGGGGDYVLIFLDRLDASGAPDGVVTCAVPDTGSFTVPGNTWPNWYSNGTLYVQLGRVSVQANSLEHNNSLNQIAGTYWTLGAGRTN
jgi:hypothetical protein